MADEVVQLERDGGVAVVTINRPQALNALTSEVLTGLEAVFAELAGDADLRCVVLTGAGEKAFVAGADIGEMSDMGPRRARAFSARGHRVLDRIASLPVPVIAAINGFCLGGGCELSLACDIVYAASSAVFGQPEVKLGLIPGFGGTQRLARRIGPMRALELVTSGRMVDAAEAKAIGLCVDVYPAEALMKAVLGVARTIAKRAPVAVRVAKAVQAAGMEAPLAVGNAYEQEAFGNLFDTFDAREGMAAFVEKRRAAFENR
jgi:enoyl-CoA hydratase